MDGWGEILTFEIHSKSKTTFFAGFRENDGETSMGCRVEVLEIPRRI